MVNKRKYVTWRSLKKGQEIYGYKRGASTCGFRGVVESANVAFVAVLKWGTDKEQIASEDTMFEVDMTDDEFRSQYAKGAVEVIQALQNSLAEYEIGYHEMWNSWIRYDPYEMAAECQDRKIKVVGVCDDILILGIGICAEYSDGERFWCHASRAYLDEMLDYYKGRDI